MTDKTEEKELIQCGGKINVHGICDTCYRVAYSSSAQCVQLVEYAPPINPIYPSPIVSDQEKEPTCGDCGKELTLVRPGKHQCDNAECVQNKPYTFSENHEKAVKQLLRVSVSEDGTIKINESDIRQLPFVKSLQTQIQELQREIDDNRKVIAANGMTIGELRKEVERLEKYIADHFNHVA